MNDSLTVEQFYAKGLAFPDVTDSVNSQGNATIDEHVLVLKRSASLGPQINAVRMYTPPKCHRISARCSQRKLHDRVHAHGR